MHYFSNLFDKVLCMFQTEELSKTCRILYQINMRNSASHWLSLQEYITMYGPLNVKLVRHLFYSYFFTEAKNVINKRDKHVQMYNDKRC